MNNNNSMTHAPEQVLTLIKYYLHLETMSND